MLPQHFNDVAGRRNLKSQENRSVRAGDGRVAIKALILDFKQTMRNKKIVNGADRFALLHDTRANVEHRGTDPERKGAGEVSAKKNVRLHIPVSTNDSGVLALLDKGAQGAQHSDVGTGGFGFSNGVGMKISRNSQAGSQVSSVDDDTYSPGWHKRWVNPIRDPRLDVGPYKDRHPTRNTASGCAESMGPVAGPATCFGPNAGFNDLAFEQFVFLSENNVSVTGYHEPLQ